jgi:dTDP-4-dehydrorhamnose 3,5-epimerase
VLSDWAEIVYKATNYYAPEWERSLLWNDADLGIQWPLINQQFPILSTKDARGTSLSDSDTYK